MEQNDLDDILESAFEDLEQDEHRQSTAAAVPPATASAAADVVSPASSGSAGAEAAGSAPGTSSSNTAEQMEELRRLMEGLSRGEFNEALEEIARSLSDEQQSGDGAPDLSSLLPDLDKLGLDAEGNVDEAAMARLVEQLGENPEMQNLMEGVFGHFVSKDILYDPMVMLRTKYPEWLEANRPKLSSVELANYERQQQIVGEICRVYETTPDDTQAVMTLMQQMQETGQPPVEIMKSLAPEMQFGADGQPILPSMDGQNCTIS